MKLVKKVPKESPADAAEKEKPNLFYELNNNFSKKSVVNTGANAANCFILARFQSMFMGSFEGAVVYNDYANGLPLWARRTFLYHLTPKMENPPFIKYVGGKKEKADNKYEMAIDKLMGHFKCKRVHAEQIYGLLEQQGANPKTIFGIE